MTGWKLGVWPSPRVSGDNQKRFFIFVMDEDEDLEALRPRPIPKRDADIIWAKHVQALDEPHI